MPRLSYANVAATLAVVIALSGTAYAAGLPKNSVGSAQIKKSAVTSSDLRNNGVTGKDVKESSLGTVPDAAKLGGVPADAYAPRAVTSKGRFAQNQPLVLAVPGYGTFSMTCDGQSSTDTADDRVGYAWDQTPLGAGATVQATTTFAPALVDNASTYLQRSVKAAGTFIDTRDSMSASALHESENGAKAVLVSAWGSDNPLIDGCEGSLVAQVLR